MISDLVCLTSAPHSPAGADNVGVQSVKGHILGQLHLITKRFDPQNQKTSVTSHQLPLLETSPLLPLSPPVSIKDPSQCYRATFEGCKDCCFGEALSPLKNGSFGLSWVFLSSRGVAPQDSKFEPRSLNENL